VSLQHALPVLKPLPQLLALLARAPDEGRDSCSAQAAAQYACNGVPDEPAVLQSPPIRETNEAELAKMAAFPNPQTVALSRGASGVFAEPDDRELFRAIVRLNAQLNEFADRLALTEILIALTGDALTLRLDFATVPSFTIRRNSSPPSPSSCVEAV
jgi:hypothetical protein